MCFDKAKNFLRRAFPPVNQDSIYRHYVPCVGAFSHTAFTINLFTPSMIERMFPNSYTGVADTILASANIGLCEFYMSKAGIDHWHCV